MKGKKKNIGRCRSERPPVIPGINMGFSWITFTPVSNVRISHEKVNCVATCTFLSFPNGEKETS